jgi:hypothetical protein
MHTPTVKFLKVFTAAADMKENSIFWGTYTRPYSLLNVKESFGGVSCNSNLNMKPTADKCEATRKREALWLQ